MFMTKKSLSDSDRRFISDVIIDNNCVNGKTLNEIDILAGKIVELFPTEKK